MYGIVSKGEDVRRKSEQGVTPSGLCEIFDRQNQKGGGGYISNAESLQKERGEMREKLTVKWKW